MKVLIGRGRPALRRHVLRSEMEARAMAERGKGSARREKILGGKRNYGNCGYRFSSPPSAAAVVVVALHANRDHEDEDAVTSQECGSRALLEGYLEEVGRDRCILLKFAGVLEKGVTVVESGRIPQWIPLDRAERICPRFELKFEKSGNSCCHSH